MKPTHILRQLEHAGYEAYFVGGCVRDTLLDRPVHDWDITTSAMPEETMAVFSHTVPTGLKHGTVTVLEDGESYEVTTFRCDGDYADGRHPDSVTFVRDLKEDLRRRDFTVNAMAMDAAGTITDLFGGREDLQQRVIRCVGNPADRFREDALRILRAFRFSAQLGFTIEENTLAAAKAAPRLCDALSAERVREELEKTLLSPKPQTVGEMAKCGFLSAFGIEGEQDLGFLQSLPSVAVYRWAGVFLTYPNLRWEDLRLDKKTGKTAQMAASLGKESRTPTQWKSVFAQYGEDTALCAASLAGQLPLAQEILHSGEPLLLRDLQVGGDDFPYLQGKEKGALLQKLLAHVHKYPCENQKELLLQLAEKIKEHAL